LADNILDEIRRVIRERLNDLADDVAGGSCLAEPTADKIAVSYARKAGVIEGIATVEADIVDLMKRATEQE
jgi:hypothetical protein